MEKGRVEKSIKNSSMAFVTNILKNTLGFVVRTMFIKYLGDTYLGLSGLFTNILSVLSIAELGIGTAIVFQMYKTVANNDEEKTKQYLYFFQKVYRIIGIIIFLAGLLLLPFLGFLIKGNIPPINIHVVFLLFLTNSASSYWMFAYRNSIVTANNESYRLRWITFIQQIVTAAIQIICLVLFKEIYLYLIVPILTGLFFSALQGITIGKYYPFIKTKPVGKLSKDEKKFLTKNIYALMLYKISYVVLGSTTGIMLSAFIGLSVLGIYSNYTLIIGVISGFISLLFTGLQSSIGNLNATSTKEHKLRIFKVLLFAKFWICGFSSICFYILFTPFISLWIGDKYLFSSFTEIIIILNFFIQTIIVIAATYRTACGLFYEGRYRPVLSMIVNIVCSIVLIFAFKPNVMSVTGGVAFTITKIPFDYSVAGAILGAIIAKVAIIFWYDGWLVYKRVFEKKPFSYYIYFILMLSFVFILAFATKLICGFVNFENDWVNLFVMLGICIVFVNVVFLICFHRTKEFGYLKNIFLKFFEKKI